MTAAATAVLLDRWYAAIRAADADALAAVTAEDVTVAWNGDPAVIPWAGTWVGRERVLAFFATVAAHLDVVAVVPDARIEAEDAVALTLAGHWRLKATGRDIRARAANLFRLRDGRIARYEVYSDTAAFAAALASARR